MTSVHGGEHRGNGLPVGRACRRPVVALYLGTPHETEIYVRLQRVDVMFSIV